MKKQECIPVGCVPAARRLYPGGVLPAWSGGVLPAWAGGSAWLGGSPCMPGGCPCLAWGVCLVWGVLPAWGGLPGLGGFSLPAWEGSPCLTRGVHCLETPLVNRITDMCKKHNLGHNFVAAGNKLRGGIGTDPAAG